MAVDRNSVYLCSGADLYLLGALAGGDTLIGVRDPFYGWLTEEILEALPGIRDDLLARSYLTAQPSGMSIAPELAPLIATLATPRAAIMAVRTLPQGVAAERAYHIGAEQITKLCRDDDQYTLEPITAGDLAADVVAWWNIHGDQGAPGSPFRLRQPALFAARDAAGDADRAAALLRDAGAPDSAIALLIAALASPLTNGSLVALRQNTMGWDTQGIAVLEGAAGLWRMRAFEHQDEPWVEVASTSLADLTQRVERLVRNAIGEE